MRGVFSLRASDSFAEHRIWYTCHPGVRYFRILEQCPLPGSHDNAASAREIVPRHVVEMRWASKVDRTDEAVA